MRQTNETINQRKEELSSLAMQGKEEFTFDLEELDGKRAMMLISPSILAVISPACASCDQLAATIAC